MVEYIDKWAWVITPLSEFMQERSYLLLPLQNDSQ